jgi:AcrR family transcriptional regulator
MVGHMPKQVDQHARRLALADALWRITRRDGWDAISLRRVAAEAGVSMGMVQHYFTTKDEMLRFALEEIAEDVRQRIRARLAELPQPHTPRRLVATLLTEMIPRPGRRESERDAAAVYVRRFLLRPESTTELAKGGADLRTFLTEQIRLARPDGDAEIAAAGLLALLDGLILNIVTGDQTSHTATTILDAQLDHVFG